MKVRTAILGLVALAAQAALAQANPSPVGTWRSEAITNRDWPLAAVVQLTVNSVEADRATGRFNVFMAGAGGGGSFACLTGPVSGQFDGSVLKVASTASNLCPERVFDMKLSGDALTGMYRGADGTLMPMTMTRR